MGICVQDVTDPESHDLLSFGLEPIPLIGLVEYSQNHEYS